MKNVLYIGNKLNKLNSNSSYNETLGFLLENEGYNLSYASSKSNKLIRLIDMLISVFKNREMVDFILIDTYSTLNFYYAFFVSQLSRVFKLSCIPILHGGNLPKRLKNNPLLCKLIFNNSYVNISPSIYLFETFKANGYQNVLFIPNTIEIENYRFLERNDQNIKLLWVRSFSKIYNPKMAIHVLDKLITGGYEVSLCMVGPDSDGSLEEVKALAAQKKLNVKFTGKLTKQEWITLSKDYTIFLNTTNFDNMPVSVIEAMALGLPIVSTNVGGIPYLIENDIEGMLVEQNNPDAMSEAIITLFKDPTLYKTLAYNARAKVEQFDWQIIKHKWFEVLN
ncbi:glycosyltransferase family 4 protein [Ichthyenterobacterium sp. W332]|uniref:Glycosyltransferase family 4 protein n=1 Tax=Microcosmobacter mediterraneus TaxID=3075607 RepID=A0ABU2YH44_9FLAO|nr:glycosyltransferase family 4 protein [Ichthyenterobacterium sp. W332]MDT0557367.1 glycosyltransferase family 4 protein [Ichthyenterobacterium sp. W332]